MNPMTLEEYLTLKKLTPAQFGRQIKVTKMSVCRYLAGRVPQKEVLQRIIKVTEGKVTADSFFLSAHAA